MKKTVFVLILALASIFAFAFSASAECLHNDKEITSVVYDDYTKQGTMSFNCPDCSETSKSLSPLVTIIGYSSRDYSSICVSYQVNNEALEYLKSKNPKLEVGLVAASKELLGNKLPLDSATAKPVDLSEYNATVLKANLVDYEYSVADLKIEGFDALTLYEQLYMTAYIFDGTQVIYLQENQSSTEIKPVFLLETAEKNQIKVDDMNYSSVKETTESAHRLMQMANSEAAYANGTSMSSSDLTSVQVSAKAIVFGGALLGYKNAASFLNHFLGNTGKQYNLDLEAFFGDSVALKNRNNHINTILRAGEELAIEGMYITVNQEQERINHDLTGDWKYSLGSYFDDVDLINLTVTEVNGEKTYSATVKYRVIDFYNWDEAKTSGFLDGKGPSQYQLCQLHRAGKAQEFLTYGEISYEISWTQGQTIDQILA